LGAGGPRFKSARPDQIFQIRSRAVQSPAQKHLAITISELQTQLERDHAWRPI